jgi:hypothetical protein
MNDVRRTGRGGQGRCRGLSRQVRRAVTGPPALDMDEIKPAAISGPAVIVRR